MLRNLIFILFILAAVSLVIVSCEPAAVQEESSFDLIQSKILTPSCAISSCHTTESDAFYAQHQLILTAGKSYQNLVGILSFNAAAKVDGLLRVKAGDPENSFLVHKLHSDASHHVGNYGSPMPLGLPKLSFGQLEYIEQWIQAGAPRTGITGDAALLDDQTPQPDYFEPLAEPQDGYQVRVGPFTISPDFEREFFTYMPLGNTQEVFVNRFEVKMRDNSHHFLIYDFKDNTPSSVIPQNETFRDIRNPDGTLNNTITSALGYHTFIAGTQTPYSDFTFPAGVGLRIPANMKFDFNSHYVNKGTEAIVGEVYANIYTIPAAEVLHEAKTLNLGNLDIHIPAGERKTITKTFLTDKPINVFALTSHTHKLGENFVIQISGGARDGEVVYENADWHHPEIKIFQTPIQLNAGEGLTSIITYNNTTSVQVNFGLTSEDEMGIIFGYYYE